MENSVLFQSFHSRGAGNDKGQGADGGTPIEADVISGF